MTSDTGINKEEDDEEDDTMQNTVVLFSNTDKFVLLQVQLLLLRDIYNYPQAFAVPRITVFTRNINKFIVNLFFILHLTFSLLFQDMCVVCGSFGKGAEGQLLACAQCAQCYHPYCVNSKVSKMLFLDFFSIPIFCKSDRLT